MANWKNTTSAEKYSDFLNRFHLSHDEAGTYFDVPKLTSVKWAAEIIAIPLYVGMHIDQLDSHQIDAREAQGWLETGVSAERLAEAYRSALGRLRMSYEGAARFFAVSKLTSHNWATASSSVPIGVLRILDVMERQKQAPPAETIRIRRTAGERRRQDNEEWHRDLAFKSGLGFEAYLEKFRSETGYDPLTNEKV